MDVMDGLYKRDLAKEFGVEVRITPFLTDSESSVKLHSNYFACKKSKHILRAISSLRHWIAVRVFYIIHIPGSTNIADLLTKPLPPPQHRAHRESVMGAQFALPLCVSAGGGVKTDDEATSAGARYAVQATP